VLFSNEQQAIFTLLIDLPKPVNSITFKHIYQLNEGTFIHAKLFAQVTVYLCFYF
jgi:hypothetical protein